MKRCSRLEFFAEFISDTFFDGKVSDVPIYYINLTKAKKAFDCNITPQERFSYGLSYFSEGIVINSDVCLKDSKTEFGTLIHEMIHQFHDTLEERVLEMHGIEFKNQCYRIGKLMHWTDEMIDKYII